MVFGLTDLQTLAAGRTGRTLGASALACLLLLGCAGSQAGGAPSATAAAAIPALSEPATEGGPAVLRLMSQSQYANTIAYVFGKDIKVATRFPPAPRIKGLLSLGQTRTGITPGAAEQFHRNAYAVADQVVDPAHRDFLIPCQPASPTKADPACAGQFLGRVGRLLYRRPLTEAELQQSVAAAGVAADRFGDFYKGASYALSGMLASSKFLFFAERDEADPANPPLRRLDAYSKASRLSLLLWDSAPDDLLIKAAETGALQTREGMAHQLDRMLASPRLEVGVRAFFGDMLGFDSFANLAKDQTIYPAFNAQTASDAPEQLLRTLVYELLTRKGDYRDLFTTRETFVTPALAMLYRAPAPAPGWTLYEFPKDSPRQGLLTQIGFLSLHAHPGRSSATKRGRALRELILCQPVPDPPPNVDFSIVEDPHAKFRTARERLTAHNTDPVCAGCHKLTDPIGLALENFDGAGQFRKTEAENAPIDASGELDGQAYGDATGLALAVRNNPATTSCLVNRMFSYAVGREIGRKDRELIAFLGQRFAQDGYRVPDLMRTIAASDAFMRVAPAPSPQPRQATASPAASDGRS